MGEYRRNSRHDRPGWICFLCFGGCMPIDNEIDSRLPDAGQDEKEKTESEENYNNQIRYSEQEKNRSNYESYKRRGW